MEQRSLSRQAWKQRVLKSDVVTPAAFSLHLPLSLRGWDERHDMGKAVARDWNHHHYQSI